LEYLLQFDISYWSAVVKGKRFRLTKRIILKRANWNKFSKIRPRVVVECDDSALLKEMGREGLGFFTAPSLIGSETARQYRVREVGRLEGVSEKFFAVSMDRQIKHPAVQAIVENAKNAVFKK
jgi:LysR family transcriptional activator of nhaA